MFSKLEKRHLRVTNCNFEQNDELGNKNRFGVASKEKIIKDFDGGVTLKGFAYSTKTLASLFGLWEKSEVAASPVFTVTFLFLAH